MNKSRKPITGKVKEFTPMTPEERKEQAAKAFVMKREQIATGILFNLCQNPSTTTDSSLEALVDAAIIMADRLIEKLYFTPKENE